MTAANPIKAAQLRALAIEEAAKKASAVPAAKPAAIPAVVVKREGGAPAAPRISVADIKETRKPIAGVQLKKVVDYLRNVRRDVSIEELHRETGVQADEDLRYSLEKNPKVSITPEGKYRFKVCFHCSLFTNRFFFSFFPSSLSTIFGIAMSCWTRFRSSRRVSVWRSSLTAILLLRTTQRYHPSRDFA